MDDSKKLIKDKRDKSKKNDENINLNINYKKEYFKFDSESKKTLITILILIFIKISLIIFYIIFNRGYNNNQFIQLNLNKKNNKECNELDPIYIFSKRLKSNPTIICENEKSRHICYKDDNGILVVKNGVFCKMKNIILDPSKWKSGGLIYKGPVDQITRGCPLLSKGFFNMKCKNYQNYTGYDSIYNNYFSGWNYDYEDNKQEKIEELAPGRTIFFISRNQDSPNLFHGGSEFINALSMVNLLNLNPKNIQVVFLESITLNDDPFYDLYKNLISRGGEPIFIKNLTKKYHISSGIHVPINWDSPCFTETFHIPQCKYATKTYQFYNILVDKYMNIKKYYDSFISDNEIFYYPKSIIESHKSGTKFTKIVTFQWRRVWPRGRKHQQRLLGNGPELAEKLSSKLPKNILLRLIDTAALPISQQISILRETDYYVGIHGAGLCLSIFSPNHCIFHEVLPEFNMHGLSLMAALSGHKTYSDIIQSEIQIVEDNEMVYFNVNDFVNSVIDHMKESNFFD